MSSKKSKKQAEVEMTDPKAVGDAIMAADKKVVAVTIKPNSLLDEIRFKKSKPAVKGGITFVMSSELNEKNMAELDFPEEKEEDSE